MSFDINIMGSPDNSETALSTDNTAIQGIQKLVQRALIIMFTDVNDPFNVGIGTSVISQTQGANITDIDIVSGIFNIAAAETKTVLVNNTPTSAPDDEKVSDIKAIINRAVTRGELLVDITITSQAGDTVSVSVPVTSIGN